MELIFDSHIEKEKYIMTHCPRFSAGGKNLKDCHGSVDCHRCWEQSGVKYRVKSGDNNNGKFAYLTTHNPYMEVDSLYPKTILDELFMDKKVEDYIREVTRGDIQMFVMSGRQQGKTKIITDMLDLQRTAKMMEKHIYGVMPRNVGRSAALKFLNEDFNNELEMLDGLDYLYYCRTHWREVLDIFMDKHDRIKKPQIENVIFNDPATIVFWKDGTKTVVKVRENDIFDEEKGLAMAICKKVFGNEDGYWSKVFKEWVPEKQPCMKCRHNITTGGIAIKCLRCALEKDYSDFEPIAPTTLDRINERNKTRSCVDCKHHDKDSVEEPCCRCDAIEHDKFEKKVGCLDCKHKKTETNQEPCRSCAMKGGFPKFEKEEPLKKCEDCKYSDADINKEPCVSCDDVTDCGNFEPKKVEKEEPIESCENCIYSGYPWNQDLCYTCGIHYANFKAADR